MASRRMVSQKIIDSARFLKMPATSQNLYFHLICHADDDGVVEAFFILRMVGASEDDLKILVAKKFVVVLNEDLVSFVTDWLEHNKIRPDRKVNSIHQELLLLTIPDVVLIEPKKRADRRGTSQGQPNVRLGKDRLGKVNTPPISSSDLSDDESQAVKWLQTNLSLLSASECVRLAKKHGMKSIKFIYEHFLFEQKKDPSLTIGVMKYKLNKSERQTKQLIPLRQDQKIVRHKTIYDGVEFGTMSEDYELKELSRSLVDRFS